jgi:hypothetical protein
MTTMNLPVVSSCSVDGCSYNHDHDCHAGAITVTGSGGDACCGTFIHTDDKGGVDEHGHVGACHRADCRHNDHLECTAPGVEVGVGADPADCLTYAPA